MSKVDAILNLAIVVQAIDNLTGPIRQMSQSFMNFERQIQNSRAMIDWGNRMAISGVLVQGALDSTTRALNSVLQPAKDVGRAIGEVSSLGVKDLDVLKRAAVDFSNQWSGTNAADFISASYDIKSGIASLTDAGVADYTRLSALTAKATKASAAEMTSFFATGYGIYSDLYSQMSDLELGEMLSAATTVSVQAFKTSGSGMAQALTALGAAAASANLPLEEQFTILGMLQATMPGGQAGTQYKAFIKTAAMAGEELGLGFVDANNQLLSMPAILDKLRGKYGDTLDAMEKMEIQKAFGTVEAVALIDLLFPKIDQLRDNIGLVGDTMTQGSSYTAEVAQMMNADLDAGTKLLGQNIANLKESFGSELAPLLMAMIPDISRMVTGFQGFAKAHPTIVRTSLLLLSLVAAVLAIMVPIITVGGGLVMMGGYFMLGIAKIGRGLGVLRTIITGGFMPVLSLVGKGFLSMARHAGIAGRAILTFGRNALFTAFRALPGLVAGVWSFTAALLANPITWIVIGIVALCAGIYLLWKNWDTVTAAMGKAWDWLVLKFVAAKDWLAGVFHSLVDLAKQYGPLVLAAVFPIVGVPLLIAQHWDGIKTTASGVFDSVRQIVSQKVTEIITAISSKAVEMYSSGRALIQTFIDGLQSLIHKPAEVLQAGLAKLRRLLPHSDALEGPLSTLTYSGMMLINTFAGGIEQRAPYLQAVANSAFNGINMPLLQPSLAGMGGWDNSPLGRAPAFNMREVLKESSREREAIYTRDRRPIVIVMEGGSAGANYEDVVDLALRRLDMRDGT